MANQLYFFLADDDDDDVELFGEMLTWVNPCIRYGYANDGVAALQQLRNDQSLPSVILLDFNMPKKGGIECLKELKADTRFKNIPVIMYSAVSYETQVETAIHEGAAFFIAKPSSIESLKNIIAILSSNIPGNLHKALHELNACVAC